MSRAKAVMPLRSNLQKRPKPKMSHAESLVEEVIEPMDISVEDQSMTLLSSRREILPETRQSQTHKFCIAGHEGYLTVGLFHDGRPGEIFIKSSSNGANNLGKIGER